MHVSGKLSALALALALAILPISGLRAQEFPSKPIRVFVGGSAELLIRIMQPYLTPELNGQPLVLDRSPLAVTGKAVAQAKPDGYTLAAYGTTLWLGPLLAGADYDPIRDFAPVTMLSIAPAVVVVRPALGVNSLKELIALAKSKPGTLNYSSGIGSISFFAAEILKSMAGIDVVHVSYKQSPAAVQALLSGEVQMMVASGASVIPFIKQGQLKGLAVTTPERSLLLPDFPTVSEAGLPGYNVSSPNGVVAPVKTPPAVISRLNRAMIAALKTGDVKEKFLAMGVEPVGNTPAEFGNHIKSELASMGKVVKEVGME